VEALLIVLGVALSLLSACVLLAVPATLATIAWVAARRLLCRLSSRAAARARARRRLRPSDGDRAAVIRRLGAQCAVGRLSPEELEERVEAAWAARTYAQLERLERDLPAGHGRAALGRFRTWLYAAALYNACWGGAVSLLATPVAWKAIGMFVLVFAPAYWWAARDPERHAHLVAVGLLGKVLGTVGFVWAAGTGRLAPEFGLVVLANDVIWWPAFAALVRSAAAAHGGWSHFLSGE
jgi:hypothetical protein